MTPEDEVEFDTLVDRVTATPQLVDRMAKVHRIRAILTFWEMGTVTSYDTVAGIRQHLNNV